MNGSKDFQASDASDKPQREDTVLSLHTVQRMMPLVRRVVTDVMTCRQNINRLHSEEDLLDDSRRSLAWPQRQRRYQVKDELARIDHEMQSALHELHELGVVMLDRDFGQVGFPTMVNNRRAFFSWQPGEDTLQTWQFADDAIRRPIPASWLKEVQLAMKS